MLFRSRNLFRRIEVVFPVEDGNLRDRLIREVLAMSLADNVKARFLGADGTYHKAALGNGSQTHRSQGEFIALARADERRPSVSKSGRGKPVPVRVVASPFGVRKARR